MIIGSHKARLRATFAVERVTGQRGYTAVELATVIVIVMILSVTGLSSVRVLTNRMPAKDVSARLSHALSTARQFAISRNGFYQVVLDLDNTVFWIDEIPNPSLAAGAPEAEGRYRPKLVGPEPIDETTIVEGVMFGEGPDVLASGLQIFLFGPDGSAEQEARIFLLGRNDNRNIERNIFTIRLYGPTGLNKIFERRRLLPEVGAGDELVEEDGEADDG